MQAFLFAMALLFAVAAAGCEPDACEDACQERYEECIERAPPGAERAGCLEEFQQCMDRCGTAAHPTAPDVMRPPRGRKG